MFGIPYANLDLALLPQYPSEIPVGLQTIKQYLIHNHGFKTKGIFRTASQQNTYKDAMEALDMGERMSEIKGMDVHVASQLLKAWFREYPVFTPGFLPVKLLDARLKEDLIREFNKIKEPNRSIVAWLIDVAVEASDYELDNSMNLESLSICLSPNLIRHEDDSTFLQYQRSSQTVFHSLCNLRKKGKLTLLPQSGDDSQLPLTPRSSEIPKFDVTDMGADTGNNIASQAVEEEVGLLEAQQKQEAKLEEEKGTEPDAGRRMIGYSAEQRHKRKKRRSSIVYASSVQELYRPSLSTGVFGTFYYPKRDVYTTIRRESALHGKEVVYQAMDIQRNPAFKLEYVADEEEAKLDLTEEEQRTITEFGAILKERYNYENVLKSELVRYVIGSKGRIAMAERRFLNMKKLEREYNLNDIQLHQIRDELKQPRYVVCGKDVQGRSVLGVNIAHFSSVKSANLALIIKAAMVYCDALTSDLDVCRNGIVLLFDMAGFRIEHLNSGLEKVFFSAFNDTYPLRIKRFIVVNAPIYIRGIINIVKVLLSKKLGNRIVSCKSEGGDKKGSLWKEIDRSQAPLCVDGTFDSNNDGTYPTNAWALVCSKISGDLPPMTAENLAEHAYNSSARLPPDMSQSGLPANGSAQEREISLSDKKWLKLKDGDDDDASERAHDPNDADAANGTKGGRFRGMLGKARNKMSQARSKVSQGARTGFKTVVTTAEEDDRKDAESGKNTKNSKRGKKGDKNKLGLTIDKDADPSIRSEAVVAPHKYRNRGEKGASGGAGAGGANHLDSSPFYANASGNLSPQSMDSMVSKSLPMPSETETDDRDVERGDILAVSTFELQANASVSGMRDVTAEAERKMAGAVIDPSDNEFETGNEREKLDGMVSDAPDVNDPNESMNILDNLDAGSGAGSNFEMSENQAAKTPKTPDLLTQEPNDNEMSANLSSGKDDFVSVDGKGVSSVNSINTLTSGTDDSKEKDAAYVTVDAAADASKDEDFVNVENGDA